MIGDEREFGPVSRLKTFIGISESRVEEAHCLRFVLAGFDAADLIVLPTIVQLAIGVLPASNDSIWLDLETCVCEIFKGIIEKSDTTFIVDDVVMICPDFSRYKHRVGLIMGTRLMGCVKCHGMEWRE